MRIQIFDALIAFLLLRLTRAAFEAATLSPLEFAPLIKVHLMHRRTIRDLFALPDETIR